SVEELLARNFLEITHPEDLLRNKMDVDRLLAGEVSGFTVEKRFVRKGGSTTWVQSTVSVARDADGRPANFIALIEDVNERKRTAKALAESEERFRSLVEATAQIIWTR